MGAGAGFADRGALTTDPGAAGPVVRPGPLRWVWYALGGGLPARHRSWVLHDTTTRTWALRHVLRAMVQLTIPIALVLTLVPGPFWIRGMAALGGVALGLIFSLAYMPETTEHRLVKAGYPAGTAQAAHEAAQKQRQAAESARKRAAAARRAQRHRDR
ncbi:DUF5313 family protein [Klenkia brasiliensis]|uniref:DUF5313 domain-containing protein n=1 Tax=Klenkia brasiliensis TaxID=333142 RepID=A0A1G7PFA5_9ACTN|nr:DUF5313 family protein [Klenkia brasiliensis]SDF84913.1 hypothetical protein SAMN05660324_1068 [Klenkia brasiliensis]